MLQKLINRRVFSGIKPAPPLSGGLRITYLFGAGAALGLHGLAAGLTIFAITRGPFREGNPLFNFLGFPGFFVFGYLLYVVILFFVMKTKYLMPSQKIAVLMPLLFLAAIDAGHDIGVFLSTP